MHRKEGALETEGEQTTCLGDREFCWVWSVGWSSPSGISLQGCGVFVVWNRGKDVGRVGRTKQTKQGRLIPGERGKHSREGMAVRAVKQTKKKKSTQPSSKGKRGSIQLTGGGGKDLSGGFTKKARNRPDQKKTLANQRKTIVRLHARQEKKEKHQKLTKTKRGALTTGGTQIGQEGV